MSVCFLCGYGIGVKQVAILVDGRITVEVDLCATHRGQVVDSVREPLIEALNKPTCPWS